MNKQHYNHKIDTVRMIIEDYYSMDLNVKTRNWQRVRARQMYYHWLAENTSLTLKGMSNSLLIKQHYSTVIWAIEKFNDLHRFNGKFKREWQDISFKIDIALGRVVDEENLILNAS